MFPRPLFGSLVSCSHSLFSISPRGFVAGSIRRKEAFSGCIARLSIAGSEQSGLRRPVSVCSNMAFMLYGTVCYGSN
jgi:hypothetical protein